MIIEKIRNIDEAVECNKLLNKLIISEKQFSENINQNFIEKNGFETIEMKPEKDCR